MDYDDYERLQPAPPPIPQQQAPFSVAKRYQQQQEIRVATQPVFIPKGLNWLNVPEGIQDSFWALDAALVNSRKENKRLEHAVKRLEERVYEIEDLTDRLAQLLKIEQDKNERLRREFLQSTLQSQQKAKEVTHQSLPPTVQQPAIDEDAIIRRAIEEMKRLFHPDEVRSTLRKVEMAAKQPNNLVKRVEALEQFRANSTSKASAIEQVRKIQKNRLEEAISSLRKLNV